MLGFSSAGKERRILGYIFINAHPMCRRLHPAVYLLALAYRTLDIEDVKRRKQTVRGVVEGQVFRLLSWCKKLV